MESAFSSVRSNQTEKRVPSHRLRFEELEERRLLSVSPADSCCLEEFDVLNLASNPGCERTLYLDFDGHTTTGTRWNRDYNIASISTPCFSLDDDNSTDFSSAELAAIYEIWLRVSEDYLPFDLNVTTAEPEEAAFTEGRAQRVCIGGTYDVWYGSAAGGVAYLNTFLEQSDTPCFVFAASIVASKSNPIKEVAEDISHEAGHTFGLIHDGSSLVSGQSEYYQGAGGWAPIMGNGIHQELVQWSKGEYAGAQDVKNREILSGHQDDLSIIGSVAEYRADDHGDSLLNASAIEISAGNGYASGIIGLEEADNYKDADWFSFVGDGTELDFWIGGLKEMTNLDALVKLYDADGNRIDLSGTLSADFTLDPADTLYVAFTLTAEANTTYYLSIEGTGKKTSVEGIYSDYGSLGAYEIIVGRPSALTLTVTTADDVFAADGELSLREAVALAGERSVIIFDTSLASSTITLTEGEIELCKSITIDASALLLSSADGEPVPGITIDAGGKNRIFSIAKRGDFFNTDTLEVELIGLTLTGGAIPETSGYALGGAIYCDGNLAVANSVFTENSTAGGNGGAICCDGNLAVANSVFTENSTAGGNGGAIYCDGNLAVANSVFTENSTADGSGGAIYCYSNLTTIEGSFFRDNSAYFGGAIYCGGEQTLLTVSSSTEFSGNQADMMGGAVCVAASGTFLFSETTFLENASGFGKLSGYGYGGAIFISNVSAAVTLEKATFRANRANIEGGAISIRNGVVNISATEFYENSAEYGGAIAGYDLLAVSESFFGGNSAQYGGAIYIRTELTLVNSVIVGNCASYYGGGLCVDNAAAVIRQSTFVGNFAESVGGGIANFGTLDISNSILVYNKYADGWNDLYANYSDAVQTTVRHTLIHKSAGKAFGGGSRGNLTSGDPAFVSWTDYGDWEKTLYRGWDLRITADSAAVDLGDSAEALGVDGEILTADFLGDLRIRGSSVDAGAYEYGEEVTFTFAGQIGCTIFLPDCYAEKTLRFDLDGDGFFDGGNDLTVVGNRIDTVPFSTLDAEKISFQVKNDDGTGGEIVTVPFSLSPVATVYSVRAFSMAGGAVLKLTIDAQNPSLSPIVRWRIWWGDGGEPLEIETASAFLTAAHYYVDAGVYAVFVETINQIQDENGESGAFSLVYTHTVEASESVELLKTEITAAMSAISAESLVETDTPAAKTAAKSDAANKFLQTAVFFAPREAETSAADGFSLLRRLAEANRRRWAADVDAVLAETPLEPSPESIAP